MRAFFLLLVLFTLIPVLELMLLIQIGTELGPLPTVGLVLFTGALGAALARWQGLRTIQKIRADLAENRLPAAPVGHGALILVAGALLVTPGVMTDVVGFGLLIPWVRERIFRVLKRWAKARYEVAPAAPESSAATLEANTPTRALREGEVIDVEFKRVPEPPHEA